MLFLSKISANSVLLECIFAYLQNSYFFISFDGVKLKKITFFKKKFLSVIIHVEKCIIQKLFFFDFFEKYYLKNIENRLFFDEKFDFW